MTENNSSKTRLEKYAFYAGLIVALITCIAFILSFREKLIKAERELIQWEINQSDFLNDYKVLEKRIFNEAKARILDSINTTPNAVPAETVVTLDTSRVLELQKEMLVLAQIIKNLQEDSIRSIEKYTQLQSTIQNYSPSIIDTVFICNTALCDFEALRQELNCNVVDWMAETKSILDGSIDNSEVKHAYNRKITSFLLSYANQIFEYDSIKENLILN